MDAADLKNAWLLSHSKNTLLLASLDQAALQCSMSTRGGRTVGQQWAHIHHVRLMWIEVFDNKTAKGLQKFDSKTDPDKEALTKALNLSAATMSDIFASAFTANKLKGFKGTVIDFFTYLVAHEAHHRGNIMLTLKLCKVKSDDKLKWQLWEYGK